MAKAVAVSLVIAAAFAFASPASAVDWTKKLGYKGVWVDPSPNTPSDLTPDSWETIQNPTKHPPPADPTKDSEVKRFLNRARRASRVLPKARVLVPTIGLLSNPWVAAAAIGITAGSTGWTVYQALSGDFGTNEAVQPGGTYCVSLEQWQWRDQGQIVQSTWTAPQPGMYLNWKEHHNNCGARVSSWVFSGLGSPIHNLVAMQAPVGQPILISGSSVYAWYATEAQYEAAFNAEPIDQATYNTYTNKITNNYTHPTFTQADNTAASEVVVESPATQTALCRDLDPDDCDDVDAVGFISLFAPGNTETYSQYLSRLRAAGYLGTAQVSLLDENTADENYGPGAVIRIRTFNQTGELEHIYQRPWPSPAPLIQPSQTIRIIANPGIPAGGGGTFPEPTEPDDCFCPPPEFNINWPNLTEKFPFGVFSYLSGFFGSLQVAEERPVFVLPYPNGLGSGSMTIDFAPAEQYRETAHTVIKVLVVLGAVYFIATVILGIGKGERLESDSD